MTTDPMPYIISAAMVGTALGYGTARWQFRHLIKRANADLRANIERWIRNSQNGPRL